MSRPFRSLAGVHDAAVSITRHDYEALCGTDAARTRRARRRRAGARLAVTVRAALLVAPVGTVSPGPIWGEGPGKPAPEQEVPDAQQRRHTR